MNKLTTLKIGLAVCTLSLACVINDDDGGGVDTETGGTSPTTMSTTNTMTTTMSTTMTADDSSGGMTMGQTDDTTAGTVGDTGTESGTTAIDPGPFVPDDPDPTLYTRVDRMGMPAVNTAFIPTDEKDNYNNADPTNDTALQFQGDINASVGFLLGALDDDITALGLTPCPNADQCANTQVRPVVIPDTLKIDLNAAAGFPNGRGLPDQVIDIVLAVTLLDLVPPPNTQSATTFAEVPLNPAANDVEFAKGFPFLAPAH